MNNDFVRVVTTEIERLGQLFLEKNAQYGNEDPLANFRTGALLNEGIDTWGAMYEEAKNYQRKHIAHVQNCDIDGVKVDESLRDIAVYALIMLYMHKKDHEVIKHES